MRLLQHITESFNRPYDYTVTHNDKKRYFCEFKSENGTDYSFMSIKKLVTSNNYEQLANVMFRTIKKDIGSIQYYQMTFHKGKGEQDKENKYRIFATILEIIKASIKIHKQMFIVFSARENSRQKLYDRMIKVLSSKFGYKQAGTYNDNKGKNYVLWNGKYNDWMDN